MSIYTYPDPYETEEIRFAYFPTKMDDGSYIWLKEYYCRVYHYYSYFGFMAPEEGWCYKILETRKIPKVPTAKVYNEQIQSD